MTDEKAATTEGKATFRILVVDDNRDGADSLALLLRMWGYDVRVAYDIRLLDAAQALGLATASPA